MKKQQVLNCTFSKWYRLFKSITVRSCIIDLPDEFASYLLSDGLVLPRGLTTAEYHMDYKSEDDDSDNEADWRNCDTQSAEGLDFDDLITKITTSISQLGGNVIPKLNWSAPKDATWINSDKTMRCSCPSEVILLLKSSDFVTHDLTDPFRYCEDLDGADSPLTYQLILREWQAIDPQDEFRCFVVKNVLIGISQRHSSVFYPSLKNDKNNITKDIKTFYNTHIHRRFPDSDYVFDVCRNLNGEVILLDFNPFGNVTDGLLFEWNELFERMSDSKLNHLEIRVVESKDGIKPHPYQCYAMPQDFVHLSCGLDPLKFEDLLKLDIQRNNEAISEEDEEERDS